MLILYIVLGILAAFVLLLLISAINAVRIKKSTDEGRKNVISYSEDEAMQGAMRLARMVQVPSVSLRGQKDLTQFYALHDVLRENFPLIHEKMERVELEGNLLYRLPGKDVQHTGILLLGHQDVVIADGEGWEYPPFSGEIADGKVHGRGSFDCKSTVMAEFAAVEELLQEGFEAPFDIYLSCSVDEEISGGGAQKIVEYLLEKNIRLDFVMDEGGAIVQDAFPGMQCQFAMVGIIEKGYMDVAITAKSKGGHSSTPPRNTPLARLAAFIVMMEKKRPFKKEFSRPVLDMLKAIAPHLSFPMRLLLGNLWLFKPLLSFVLPMVSPYGEALLRTTFAFTMCEGSQTPNVIPNIASVTCNLRVSAHEDCAASLALMQRYAAKYELEVEMLEGENASACVDVNGKAYRFIEESLHACFPDIGVAPYFIMGGTDCRNYEAVSDACLRFCPVRVSPQQLEAMHSINENIDISSIMEAQKFYKYVIQNYK